MANLNEKAREVFTKFYRYLCPEGGYLNLEESLQDPLTMHLFKENQSLKERLEKLEREIKEKTN